MGQDEITVGARFPRLDNSRIVHLRLDGGATLIDSAKDQMSRLRNVVRPLGVPADLA